MGAGALLRDGKVQMSQIPTPLPGGLPGWGQSSPCQVLARQGKVLGGRRGARGLEKERRREVPRPLSCQPLTVGFSLFGNASASLGL